ncbi:hypothetical protein HYH02_010418 [Chlamydomonas schloesseri]|uniref:Chlorophyllase n=1 Tax=Chlamydomonas schloesseri TaxID=2026947 RepID=A0A835TMQ2_9CHLO|nr:hypothetical protein HYH02_010418 [Chlamydomonas schloesseri]|eukprot:KAG2440540.1 hypothetical protein HYH02_010418 [Chlamydomonas schloesseri]
MQSLKLKYPALTTPGPEQQHEPRDSTPEHASLSFTFSYHPVKERTGDENEPPLRKVSVRAEVSGLTCVSVAGALAPVLIFSSGFLTPAAAYGTLLQQLTSAGCVVVSYDKSFETLSYLMDDNDSVRLLEEVWRRAAALLTAHQLRHQQQQPCQQRRVLGPTFLVGHSRGAKVSVLAAAAAAAAAAPVNAAEAYSAATGASRGAQDDDAYGARAPPSTRPMGKSTAAAAAAAAEAGAARATAAAGATVPGAPAAPLLLPLAGIVLLDPADGAFEPQDPDRYPSALTALAARPPRVGVPPPVAVGGLGLGLPAGAGADAGGAAAGAGGRQAATPMLLPALVVGAGRGGDCVPRSKNFRLFYEAWPGPRVLVTLPDAGHLQFLDASDRLTQSICATGRGIANAAVAAAAATATAAFARAVVAAGYGMPVVERAGDAGAGAAAGGGAVGAGGGEEALGATGARAGGLGAAELRRLCEEALQGATSLKYSVVAAEP